MFSAPPETPLSVGDLIGCAIRIYRPNIRLFFKLLIGPTIVSMLGAICIQWAIDSGLSETSQSKTSMFTCLLVLITGLIAVIFAKWILTIRQLAFVRLSTGFSQDLSEALIYVNKKKWHVFNLFFVLLLISAVIVILWVLVLAVITSLPKGGFVVLALKATAIGLSIFGLLGAILFTFLVTNLSLSMIACEQETLGATINRSISLSKRDLLRSFYFAFLLIVVLLAISYPMTLPVVVISIADVCKQSLSPEGISESYKAPFFILVLSEIWESMANMLIWPIMFLAYGLFYHDLRLRQEGLDIARRLETLEQMKA